RPARAALGPLGASHDLCPADCCPNPRGERPACCQGAPAGP
ncbi:MAG: ferrochelatase, partial [Actinomycetota bacterium]|nr:ferrochelatase [Actinomycetota bacterium]